MAIRILEYEPGFQNQIDLMMGKIQSEFTVAINGPQSAHLNQFYNQQGYKFWVAENEGQIVGTIGVKFFSQNKAEIKRMMVDPHHRGSEFNTAKLLLDTALRYAKEKKCNRIYLGTMEQFLAAQKFYKKFGFQEIATANLPSDYIINPIDKLFYTLEL